MRPHLSLVDPQSPAPLGAADAFRTWSGYVAALAFRLLGREAEVDDVVQDVFLIALDGLGNLRHPAAAKSWLGTLTVRTVARRLRVQKVSRFFGLEAHEDEACFESTAARPDQLALLAQVWRVIERLPVTERLAWVLRYVEGCELEEVATLCQCSLATAKRRISAAQRALEVLHAEP